MALTQGRQQFSLDTWGDLDGLKEYNSPMEDDEQKDLPNTKPKTARWADRYNILKTIKIKGLGTWVHLYVAENKDTKAKVLRLKKHLNWFSIPNSIHLDRVVKALKQGGKEHGWDVSLIDGVSASVNSGDVSDAGLEVIASSLKKMREEKVALKRSIQTLKEIQEESRIFFYQERIKEFEERLLGSYSETTGPNSWQRWIYENNWLFGIHYQTPIEKEKVGFDSIPDYLFPTWDGFIDILEIKKPTEEVVKRDPSHAGSYMWSSKTNEAIGQVVNYINEVDLNKLVLRERIEDKYPHLKDIITVKPRAFILVGRSESMSRKDKEALRKLNYSLHGIEVVTYTDLLTRGKKIIEMYQQSAKKTS